MIDLKKYEFWFVTGSQDLYGADVLRKVEEHSKAMVKAIDAALPCTLVWKPVAKGSDAILTLAREANADPACAGIVTWMHTFSPSKMWIAGLDRAAPTSLPPPHPVQPRYSLGFDRHGLHEPEPVGPRRPRAWLHRRAAAPAAQGSGRATGRMPRSATARRLDARRGRLRRRPLLKVVRFGDNMREVAVTEGDKVEAQITFGWSVNGWGVGRSRPRLRGRGRGLGEATASTLTPRATPWPPRRRAARARAASGSRRGSSWPCGLPRGARGRRLHHHLRRSVGLPQLPGLASQRLMAAGYGFGAEGDWKTSALVRAMKVMASGLPGGTSFMEDYTYHFEPGREACSEPTCSRSAPRGRVQASLEFTPGHRRQGRSGAARLRRRAGPALNATLVDLGGRFRMIVNEVDAVAPYEPMPSSPWRGCSGGRAPISPGPPSPGSSRAGRTTPAIRGS